MRSLYVFIESKLKELILSEDSYASAMAKKIKEKYNKYWGSLDTLNKSLIILLCFIHVTN